MVETVTTRLGAPGFGRGRDLDRSPLIAFYELTRACDLVCVHCRACAQRSAAPGELTTRQARSLVDRLASFPEPPMLVLTGGDPLKRPDVFELIDHAVASGLETAITPSATPLVTPEALRRLRDAGIARLAVSLDGADAPTHDRMRGVAGSFDHTLRILAEARALGIPLQVNTTLHPANFDQIAEMADRVEQLGVVLWSVFFIVPVGRATDGLRLSGEQHELAFARLYDESRRRPYAIKTTEAPHYRRFLLQQARTGGAGHRGRPLGVNDGKGILFIGHTGRIHPSGFLPIDCGQFPDDDPVAVYQDSPIFRRLRAPDSFSGKCGRCEFRHVCGGSRARAYAVTGDPFASEPDCTYIPRNGPTTAERP
jgi:MoaA/NifB/PqqE/SkfB family radical SAM enzyme